MLATRISSNIIQFTLTKPSSLSILRGQTGAQKSRNNLLRLYSQEARSGFSRHTERRRVNLKDAATSRPATSTPFNIGQSAVAGASALGLGALAFYGLGLGREAGALDRSVVWPQYVKERIRDTYLYFGASIGATAATAVAVFRTPALANIVFRQGWIALGVSIAAMIGSGILVRSIPYENTLPKHLAWLTHCAVMGAVVAPICLLGGPILTRAAWYTGGMVSGLSLVAATAPSDKFLYSGGALAMGFGVVFASSIGSMFLPPTSMLGASLYSVALYGGLILFGGFLLYDTQKIIAKAEGIPQHGYGLVKFDPINSSIGIYVDTMNIFIRIAQMLAMGGGNKRR